MIKYSFVIPVYNRPNEIEELLHSFLHQKECDDVLYEIVIIEDGSSIPSVDVVEEYNAQLDIVYLTKENTGPGDSRNYGMHRARGSYFIILDSDCILPETYVRNMHEEWVSKSVDFWGGPDAAHPSFSALQKAINYSMTSFLTTGGIRGGKLQMNKFQPRSFNMGISKEAFEASKGFGDVHPGEDPDLVLRLWKLGFTSQLFNTVFVYHKRRIDWSKFYKQVNKFGLVRPILNHWHPESRRITFWLPTLFSIGFVFSILFSLLSWFQLLYLYALYFVLIFIDASIRNVSPRIGFLSLMATMIQFFGYGKAFLVSTIAITWMNKLPRKRFPQLFFK